MPSDYANYGGNPQNITSEFGSITLEPPTLNITQHSVIVQLPETYLNTKFLHYIWTDLNETYTQEYISKNGICQPTKVRHSLRISGLTWGF